MAKRDPRAEKQAANDKHALKYVVGKKKGRKQRRKLERRARVERRELAWLAASGIPRDERWPLA